MGVVTNNERATTEEYGQQGWLRFLPAGRTLVDPLPLSEALEEAIFGQPGGGTIKFRWKESGEVEMSEPAASANLPRSALPSSFAALRAALSEGRLTAFACDPQYRLHQIDRMYWWRSGLGNNDRLREGVGVPDDLVGAIVMVDRDALSEWSTVASKSLPLPELPEIDEPIVMATAAAIRDCEGWLRTKFDEQTTATWAKPQFREKALEEFSGRLSGRGFDSAWRAATSDFPDRARPGAKPKL